jgi:hypothetical protein
MTLRGRWSGLLAGCLVLSQVAGFSAEAAKRLPTGPLITIHTTRALQFELVLDEVGLDWSSAPGAKTQSPAQSVAPIAGTTVLEAEATHALLAVPAAATPADLLPTAAALMAANPGSETSLVLYEPGLPKSKRTRQFLTREVGLLMEQGVDPRGILADRPAGTVRPVPGVPDGYVVATPDPLAALDFAEAVRQQPGVRSAYPLLKRHHIKR